MERDAPVERPGEGGVAPLASPQSEGAGRVLQVQGESFGLGVEAGHHPAQQPRRRGADDAQPELLDVPGAGIVAQGVDDWIGPGGDGKSGWPLGRGADVGGVDVDTAPGWGGGGDWTVRGHGPSWANFDVIGQRPSSKRRVARYLARDLATSGKANL